MHKPLIAASLFLASVVVCVSAFAGTAHARRPLPVRTWTHVVAPAPVPTGVTQSEIAPGLTEVVFDDSAAETVTPAGALAVLSDE